jgi:hypothetical protein
MRIEERRDLGRARFPGNGGRALRNPQPAAISHSGRSDEKTVCTLESKREKLTTEAQSTQRGRAATKGEKRTLTTKVTKITKFKKMFIGK